MIEKKKRKKMERGPNENNAARASVGPDDCSTTQEINTTSFFSPKINLKIYSF
jgi:hypothetical protein